MSDNYVLNLFADIRNQLLNVVTSLSKSQFDYIPKGFSNNVHWQLGHVLTVTDELIFEFSGVGSRIPVGYKTYFSTGTDPLNWPNLPSETEILIKKLESQISEICKMYDGRLAQPVPDKNNFL